MTSYTIEIANRLIAGENCTRQELSALKHWLSDHGTRHEVESWLAENWDSLPEADSSAMIEAVYLKIQEYETNQPHATSFSFYKFMKVYQKVAAFLLVPVIVLGVLYWVNYYSRPETQFFETIAPRGQKSQILLADGTKVWLNSDTKIKYPGIFSKNERDVYLDGEAFFEVSKNAHQPFVVHTPAVNVKVLGTKFNVKAYSDENLIETSLFEGKIDLMMNEQGTSGLREKEVAPGQSFIYSKTLKELTASRFEPEEINGWKKNQLIFKDDTFNNLVRRVERWYDVDIVYNEMLFNNRRLTVELYEGERLERLMEIIGLALSVDYKFNNGKIILTPKKKNI